MTIAPKFVDRVPSEIEEGIIYISTSVNIGIHLCPCGCKTEIVTPFDPTEWKFTYDGETISLDPSVGVWGAECKSHYWIKRNQIKWSRTYSESEIYGVRNQERSENYSYYRENKKYSKQEKNWFKKLLNLIGL